MRAKRVLSVGRSVCHCCFCFIFTPTANSESERAWGPSRENARYSSLLELRTGQEAALSSCQIGAWRSSKQEKRKEKNKRVCSPLTDRLALCLVFLGRALLARPGRLMAINRPDRPSLSIPVLDTT